MTRPRSQVDAVCQNPHCRFYLREEDKDIIKSGKYATGHQRYYCYHCNTYFMETKGTRARKQASLPASYAKHKK